MTKYRGTIVLKKKPYKIIEWLTMNFDKEIGAIGIGQVEDGILYVEKLFFPKQEVTAAHVHIDPAGFGDIIRELSMEDLGRINFYWHKHPDGYAGHSGGDEEETIDVFMDESYGRKIMGFLVTSNYSGTMKQDCRIEIRDPVWASIESQAISEEDTAVEEECRKILEKCIIKPVERKETPEFAKWKDKLLQTGHNCTRTDQGLLRDCGIDRTLNYNNTCGETGDLKLSDMIGNMVRNKKKLTRFVSKDEDLNEEIEILVGNGMGFVVAYAKYQPILADFFKDAMDLFSDIVTVEKDGLVKYNLVPKAKMYDKMKEELKKLYSLIDQERKRLKTDEIVAGAKVETPAPKSDKDIVMKGYPDMTGMTKGQRDFYFG